MLDKIKQIKKSRLSEEELYLFEIRDGLVKCEQKSYEYSIFWEKDGVVLFEQDLVGHFLRVNCDKLWFKILDINPSLQYHNIQLLISFIFNDYTYDNDLKVNTSSGSNDLERRYKFRKL